MISATEAREAVHVLLLRKLGRIRDGRAVILEGGVDLRLVHGSPRYSEDMDLDGEPESRLAIRGAIRGIFDIDLLLGGGEAPSQGLVEFLAETIEPSTLRLAHERTLELEYPEYESLVVRFLEDHAREGYRPERKWDEMRLRAASLIEEIQAEQTGAL